MRSHACLLAALALTGCAAAGAGPAAIPPPAAAAEPDSGAEIWAALEGGGYAHRDSGAVCPESLTGGLSLESRRAPLPEDMFCDFTGEGGKLTLYVTAADRLGGREAAFSAPETMMRMAQSKSAEKVTLPAPDLADEVSTMGLDVGAGTTGLWVVESSGWIIKVRATYHDRSAGMFETAVAEILSGTHRRVGAGASI